MPTDRPTPTEKARAIIGHEPACPAARKLGASGYVKSIPGACTCPPLPLAVRIAAEEGTLRKRHEWSLREPDDVADEVCDHCGARSYRDSMRHVALPPGPCYPPLDDAKRWQVTRAVCRAYKLEPDRVEATLRGTIASSLCGPDEDAIVRDFLDLKQAGLIPAPPVAKVRP